MQTGARLHFGPLAYRPAQGPNFGGIGLMLESPGVRLTAQATGPADADDVCEHSRAARMLLQVRKRLRRKLGNAASRGLRLVVESEIPPHAGLGSGTQLALAVAEAATTLANIDWTTRELAELSGRGERSAIGLNGYRLGGFLVDAGHHGESRIGDLACRVAFPERWRVLLVRPRGAGLHGAGELAAFRELPSMPDATTAKLCQLVVREILPAIQSLDYARFAAAAHQYGRRVGEFFAPLQGGVFASSEMRALWAGLPGEAMGAAQSSWGPTVAAFAESEEEARALTARIQRHPLGGDCQIDVTRARNEGRSLLAGPPANGAPARGD